MSEDIPVVAEATPATPDTETSPDAVATVPLSLEERIAYLESQNDGLKRVGMLGLILVLLLGALLVHSTYSDLRSTSTRGLTLLNDQNQLNCAVTTDELGRVQFIPAYAGGMLPSPKPIPDGFRGYVFYDTAGNPRMMLGENQQQDTVFLVIDPKKQAAFNPMTELKSMAPPAGKPKASPTPSAPTTKLPSPTPARP